MPYNYIIDPKIRENYKIDFENSIIIIDEAHNIEKVSEEVAGFEISFSLFNIIMQELSSLIVNIENNVTVNHGTNYKFQSTVHTVLEIMCMTKNFMHYMMAFDKRNNPDTLDIKEI